MPLNISGTTGISGIDGSVSAPAVTGTDSNTGITFPAADTIKFSTGGVERISITNSGISGTGISAGITMADQWKLYNSQTTSADTQVDLASWARNSNNFSGIGSAMTNSSANFTFPSTGIYFVSYNIVTYITSGNTRYISPRMNFNGSDICHPWGNIKHDTAQTLTTTGSQAILDVTNTSHVLKFMIQSAQPVVVVGTQEAGYNSGTAMSEAIFIRLGDT